MAVMKKKPANVGKLAGRWERAGSLLEVWVIASEGDLQMGPKKMGRSGP